jgi:histidinol-phosphate aminotransferase
LPFIREDVKQMHAYVVQNAAGMVKLDAMENPFTLDEHLQQQLGIRLGGAAVNRYPGEQVQVLKQALADYVDLPRGYGIVLGNGSDELISMLCLVSAQTGACVLAPEPGFVMYAMSAKLQGLKFVGVDLDEEFGLDELGMTQAIQAHRPAWVYLAYPNNPTANLWNVETIKRLIAQVSAYGGWVVMDEAYQPFSSHSWLEEIRQDPQANRQVLLMRTLSKFGLAGVRIGYLVGPQALVDEVDKIRPPYNVSVLNAECALFALEHAQVFAEQARIIRQEREHIIEHLSGLRAVKPFPSQGNMVLVRFMSDLDAKLDENQAKLNDNALRIYEGLKARGIMVKNVSKMHTLLSGCLRLTVGTEQENQKLLEALDVLCA